VHDAYSSIQLKMYNVSDTTLFNILELVLCGAVSADTNNIFDNRLDKFQFNQNLKFYWKAHITGIGSHSLKYI